MSEWLKLSDLQSPVRERNLQSVRERHPLLYDRLSNFFSSERIRARVADNYVDAEIQFGARWITISRGDRCLEDVQTVATNMATAWHGGRDLVIALGSGLGLWLNGLGPFLHADRTSRRGLIIIEPLKEMVLLALSLTDLTEALSSPRVFWCVGLDWQHQLERALLDEHLAGAQQPYSCITSPSADRAYTDLFIPFADVFGRAQQTYRHTTSDIVSRLAQHYHDPKAGDSIRSVYILTHRQGYATRFVLEGLAAAFQRQGIRTAVRCVEPGRFYAPETPLFDLDQHQPDLIVSANHPFSYYAGPSVRDLEVPQLLWYTDPPVHELAEPRLGEHDIVACFDPGYLEALRTITSKPVMELPTAANLIEVAEPQADLACDVVLVGSVRAAAPILNPLDSPCRQWVEECVEDLLTRRGMDLMAAIQVNPAPQPLGQRPPTALANLILTVANTRHRVRCVMACMGKVIRLYGTEAWLEELPEESRLRSAYHGFVESPEHLAAIYRSSRIVLAPHGLLARGGLTMACWNAPLQQACVLTDALPLLDRYFVPGLEIATYTNTGELRDSIGELLDDEEKRRTIANAGRERVTKEHTFDSRAATLLGEIPAIRRK